MNKKEMIIYFTLDASLKSRYEFSVLKDQDNSELIAAFANEVAKRSVSGLAPTMTFITVGKGDQATLNIAVYPFTYKDEKTLTDESKELGNALQNSARNLGYAIDYRKDGKPLHARKPYTKSIVPVPPEKSDIQNKK